MSGKTMRVAWATSLGEIADALRIDPAGPPRRAGGVRRGMVSVGTRAAPGDAKVVVLSRAEFDDLVAAAEDASDLASVRRSKAASDRGGLPGTVVLRMLKGENRLRVLREHRGLTLDQLAEKLAEAGVKTTKGNLSHIETGRQRISGALLGPLARSLGVTADDLLG